MKRGRDFLPPPTSALLVSQGEVRIEHFRREAGGLWRYRAQGVGQRVVLTGGVDLDCDTIFAGVFELPGD